MRTAWMGMLILGLAVVSVADNDGNLLANNDCKGEAKMNDAHAARGKVIYNLDCTQFFMGTFGPIVPETIDKFVDTHAALGITDLFINVNAKQKSYYKGCIPFIRFSLPTQKT